MDRILKLKEFLESNPQDSFVQHALALEFLKAGDQEQAESFFLALLNRDEDYIGSYYHLAQLYQQSGKEEEALKWYEKGMVKAKAAGDDHAYRELQAAYEELKF